jgi:DNA polymerase-3 subunit alpha
LSALGRPGCSKEERKEFILRRFGKQKITYQHDLLEGILNHTYGVKVYDEDLLLIGQKVAGWPLHKADVLRKITKLKEKGAALVLKTQGEFVTDAVKHSKIPKNEAEMIWNDVIKPMAKYGFARSHATAYGELGYRTAYYKYYAPAPFLAAKLNAETAKSTGTEEDIEIIKKDAKSFGIKITPCDVNVSKKYYAVKDKRTIVTGFSAIKGLGEKALEALIAHQPYTSFEDFLHRTPSTAVNKSVVVALAKAGAFDSFKIGRKYAAEHYAEIRKEMLAWLKKEEKRVAKIACEKGEPEAIEAFRDLGPDWSQFKYSELDKSQDDYSLKEKLIAEKEVLGEYISGSVDILYPGFFKGGLYAVPFSKIQMLPDGQPYYLEGIVNSVRELPIKKPGKNQGKIMAKLVVENLKGETIDLTLWADVWAKQKKNLAVGTPMRALTKVNEFNGAKSLILANLEETYKVKE